MTDGSLMQYAPDTGDHDPMPVDPHGNGPVDDDHWDHDACSCGSPSWASCPGRLHAAGQPCEEYDCTRCDPDLQVEP